MQIHGVVLETTGFGLVWQSSSPATKLIASIRRMLLTLIPYPT